MNKDTHVEVIGLEGLSVTEKARELVERAGFRVTLKSMSESDLLYLKATIGADRLPVARTEDQMFQGMRQIRAQFAK